MTAPLSQYNVIGGGSTNALSGSYNAILGGSNNSTSATTANNNSIYNSILGGSNNSITSGITGSTVLGGSANLITGQYATVGGYSNTANNYNQIVLGRFAIIDNDSKTSATPTGNLLAIGNGTSTTSRNDALRLNNIGGLSITSVTAQTHFFASSAMDSVNVGNFPPKYGTYYHDNNPVAWGEIHVPVGGPPSLIASFNLQSVADIIPGPRVAGSTQFRLISGFPASGYAINATPKAQTAIMLSVFINGTNVEVRTWNAASVLVDTDYYVEIIGRG